MAGTEFRKVDARTFKYFGEEYAISWNMTKRLAAGQVIDIAVVPTITVEDSDGIDVTSQMVDLASISTTTSIVSIKFKKNAGKQGGFYYALYLVTTSGPASILGQLIEVQVR